MTKSNPRKSQEFSLEQGLADLTALVEEMETQQLPLEKALEEFERGVKLIRQCQQSLNAAEQKVSILLKKDDREELLDFTDEKEGL